MISWQISISILPQPGHLRIGCLLFHPSWSNVGKAIVNQTIAKFTITGWYKPSKYRWFTIAWLTLLHDSGSLTFWETSKLKPCSVWSTGLEDPPKTLSHWRRALDLSAPSWSSVPLQKTDSCFHLGLSELNVADSLAVLASFSEINLPLSSFEGPREGLYPPLVGWTQFRTSSFEGSWAVPLLPNSDWKHLQTSDSPSSAEAESLSCFDWTSTMPHSKVSMTGCIYGTSLIRRSQFPGYFSLALQIEYPPFSHFKCYEKSKLSL